jgi:hypothetical protein
MRVINRVTLAAAASVAASAIVAAGVALVPAAQAQTQTRDSFVGGFGTLSVVSSTVPGNGDENPYGVAVVGHSLGNLHKGDVLVSNFNNSAADGNQQGTGTTIVEISPGGQQSLFAQINKNTLPGACPGGVGLTTALTILRGGWVVVGSLPTNAGLPTSSKAGCLIVLNKWGQVVETFHGQGINGPWDMTSVNFGGVAELFVTNVLNGTVAANSRQLDTQVDKGTVLRLVVTTPDQGRPRLLNVTQIGSGFPEELDAAALVIGPTGAGLGRHGTLYIADTLNNRIAAIPDAVFRHSDAGSGNTVSEGAGLNGPLGLAIAPGGDILTTNGNDGNLVETTPSGNQVAVQSVNPAGAGSLFGLAVAPHGAGVYLVDDALNNLDLWH